MTASPALYSPAFAHLLRERQTELDQLFAQLPVATPEQARGSWKGTLMAVRGLDWLPRGLAARLYRALALPINPWQGKSLEGRSGDNRWLSPHGIAFGHFRIEQALCQVDGHPVLLLDYNVPENPVLLRSIRGEARLLGEQQLLARMNWQGRQGQHRILYFTLTLAE